MIDHGEEYFGFMKMDAGRLTFAAAKMGPEISRIKKSVFVTGGAPTKKGKKQC